MEEPDLEKLHVESNGKLADVERRTHVLAHKKDTLNNLTTVVDKTGAKLKSSEEYDCYLEDKVSKQRNQLLEKD